MVSARGAYEMEAHDLYNAKRKQAFYSLAGMCRIVRKINVSGLRSPHIVKEHRLSFPVEFTHLLPIINVPVCRKLRVESYRFSDGLQDSFCTIQGNISHPVLLSVWRHGNSDTFCARMVQTELPH